MALLSFEHVYKDYARTAVALQGISFVVGEGEFTALAGPSGSGKTTVLNLAAGLDSPSRGSIQLLGKNIGRLSKEELTNLRRQWIGFIFQSYNLFPVLTALENVEYPLALKNVPTKLRRELAKAYLDEVGLTGFVNRFPSQLSGGQQQRVAVARAMVTNPKIVFADEPTANLDSKSAQSLLSLFQTLNQRKRTTFLFSSHDPRVLNVAQRVITLSDGKIHSDTIRTPNPSQTLVFEARAELPH